MSNQPPNDTRPSRPFVKPVWQIDQAFEAGEFVVEVSKDTSRKPTKYSMRIGTRRADGTVNGNILVRKEDNMASGKLATDYSGILSELIAKAVVYMHEKIGWEWHQWVEHRIQREETKTGSNPQHTQKVRSPGKTERERAKRTKKPA